MRVRFLAATLVLTLLVPQIGWTQSNVVSPAELRQAIEMMAKTRQKNLAQVNSFFSTSQVRDALKSAKVDYRKVERAVSTLNADELARLASRTYQIQHDLSAGALSNQDLTYIVIALAAAVLVLVIVAA
jgi:hypothetical protein